MSLQTEAQKRDSFGSRLGFIMAAAGSAVGLGNLVKFPAVAGANGGGAFVFVYFVMLLVVGFTLMLTELALGRHTQLNAIGAFRKINKKWSWVGGMGVAAGFLILSYYSVIGGWVLSYIGKAATGAFAATGVDHGAVFGELISQPAMPILFHGIFMGITLLIVMGGISGGIEKVSKLLMPALFVMIIIIMFRSLTLEGGMEGVRYLLKPDFSKINGTVILNALGQVFFSLSLGMGCMITYGSYLNKKEDLVGSSLTIPLLDTGVALIAGLAVLPAMFAFGFQPSVDSTLGNIFVILPGVFANMPLGALFGVIFFVLVLFAAITSAISLLEVCVAYVVDELKISRKVATLVLGCAIFLFGIPSSLSFGIWGNAKIFAGMNFFEVVDFLSSNVLLPLGGMFLCIFVGWIWGMKNAVKEVTNGGTIAFGLANLWSILVKFVAPVAIAIVFINGIIPILKSLF